jgi:GIY-YIG catalytic domain
MEADQKPHRLSPNAYLSMAEHMRTMASNASGAETRSEFSRLAALYRKLAARYSRGPHAEPDPPPLVAYKGVKRGPLEETYFFYGRESIAVHAPSAPGVYALWNKDCWIYVGESSDVQRRLLEHLGARTECISRARPTAFGFELLDDPIARIARQSALIRDLMPIC